MDFTQKTGHPYAHLLDLLSKKEPCVLATVTGATGSTPQKAGSSAIYNRKGLISGTVGGGSVEMKMGKLAKDSIITAKSGYYSFDLNHDISEFDSSICGGKMNVLLDASPEKHHEVFEQAVISAVNRVPGIMVTFCGNETTNGSDIKRFWITADIIKTYSRRIPGKILTAAEEILSNPISGDFMEITLSGLEADEFKLVFLESIVPPPQLVIAGAGHVGKALSHFGKLLGFEVIVWDDRPEYANKNNLPDADKIFSGNLDESLENITVGQDTFIVLVTRGHKKDADVLRKCIGSKAGYIGMIGSRRKIVQVRESFLENGWATPQEWNKIHTPVGLDIGAVTVQEIAVSIAAQLIQVRSQNRKK